ncbi:plasmid recombination/mobilization protein [Streptococcus pneumoniae]|nr:plasmid recombination/mobilization protein [Streptococcus pneumoniae]
MKNIEVPTGEKTLFGKEKMKTEKKPTENVIITERDYKKLMAAARDNEKLKSHIKNMLNTDMAKENQKLVKQNEQVKEKYNGLARRFNGIVGVHNELIKENESLKARISDLRAEIGEIYKSTKKFLKERTNDLKAFKNVFKQFTDGVKEKVPGGEFERLEKRERAREQSNGMER